MSEAAETLEAPGRGGRAVGVMGFVIALAVGFFAMRAFRMHQVEAATLVEGQPRVAVPLRGNEPTRGPADALVTVVAFSDYQCPFCAAADKELEALMNAYPGDLRVVYKHMPMPHHKSALSAARMAWAAHQQGRFFALHPLLFDPNGDLAGIPAKAETLEIDLETLFRDAASDEAGAEIDEDFRMGARLGVTGTPTFFVNGRRWVGALQRPQWTAVIDAELEDAKAMLEQGVPRGEIYERLTSDG